MLVNSLMTQVVKSARSPVENKPAAQHQHVTFHAARDYLAWPTQLHVLWMAKRELLAPCS
jgi:hypothetical protein